MTIGTFVEGVCPQHDYRTKSKMEWDIHLQLPHKTYEQLKEESLTPFGRELRQNHPLLFKSIDDDWWGPAIIITGFGLMIWLKWMGLG